MCVYGYCRISTKQQSIDRQIRNIKKEYDTAVIVTESYSGTTFNRPEWNKLYKKLKEGGTIIFKYLMALAKEQIKIAFEQAQKEVDDLHQRTKEGIATARLNGKQIRQRVSVEEAAKAGKF